MNQKHPMIVALKALGVLHRFEQIVAASRKTPDLKAVEAMLKAFKIEAEAKYKALALENHPDRGGDEVRMQEINAAWDIVKAINVRPAPPPQPPPQVIIRMHVNMGGWGGGTSATNSSTSYTMDGDGWVRVG